MLVKKLQSTTRKGQALVEYALLIAGIAIVGVVAIAVMGHKISDQFGMMAAILPGAHVDDNKPIQSSATLIPFDTAGTRITLDAANLVSAAGIDRTAGLLGAGGSGVAGELILPD